MKVFSCGVVGGQHMEQSHMPECYQDCPNQLEVSQYQLSQKVFCPQNHNSISKILGLNQIIIMSLELNILCLGMDLTGKIVMYHA